MDGWHTKHSLAFYSFFSTFPSISTSCSVSFLWRNKQQNPRRMPFFHHLLNSSSSRNFPPLGRSFFVYLAIFAQRVACTLCRTVEGEMGCLKELKSQPMSNYVNTMSNHPSFPRLFPFFLSFFLVWMKEMRCNAMEFIKRTRTAELDIVLFLSLC